MSAAIVYYSETGNTHSVVQMALKRLEARGVKPDVFRLKPLVKLNPGMKNAEFECLPDLSGYGSILFASPVQAFSLAPAMSIYLAKSGPLNDKRVCALLTQQFPFAWMGGRRALRQLEAIVSAKGALMGPSSIVNWSSKSRDMMIECAAQMAEEFLEGTRQG